jgi:hypothetical protein
MHVEAVLDNENRVFTQVFSNRIFNESDVHQKARPSWFVSYRPVERLPVCVTENPLTMIWALDTTSSLMIFIARVYTVFMRLIPLLTVILALTPSSLAAKLEGVYVGTLGQTQVVFKLKEPSATDVNGTYYYRNYSRDLLLDGTLSGSSLMLEERSSYGGDAKAKLNLKPEGTGFSGTWTDVKSGKTLVLKLRTLSPSDLKVIKLPNTVMLRKWKLEQPYEYLRFTTPLRVGKFEKFNAKNVRWFLEPKSNVTFFRLPTQSKAVNDALTDEHYGTASNALHCPDDSPDAFSYTPKITLYSSRILSVNGLAYSDCGGAHPDAYNANLTLDLQSAKVLTLEDAYRFVPFPKGLNLQTQEPFEVYSNFTLARAAVLKKLILQEVKSFSGDADCDKVYQTEPVFQFISWYFTPDGLMVQPSFPHVMAACEDDFLLPYAKLRPYLAANSPLK